MRATVTYEVHMPSPQTHLFEVEMIVPDPPVDGLDLVLPAWTPGSYKIRDFSRHVQDLKATSQDGRPLDVHKLDKNTYRVACHGASEVRLAYRVYANEATVRTSHLDDRHGFFNGTNLFFFVRGESDRPARLVVHPPAGWHVTTGMKATGDNVFEAPDYDRLGDSPVECGTHPVLEFKVADKRHLFALVGAGNYHADALRADVAAICQAEINLFGELPCDDYTFIANLTGSGSGGLEHLNSTALMFPRFNFKPLEKYTDFLSLCAHEYFHLWNGKRTRPVGLGPFDYEQEVHTRSLWVVEGWTSYYDRLMLRRAGLINAGTLLERYGKTWNSLRETPGRHHQSLAESSFDTWIKFYQRSPHSTNSSVSYYEKGSLVALLLDLEIRTRSDGRGSLDDVVRLMWTRYGRTGQPYEESVPKDVAEEVVGSSLSEFFARYVYGTDELDMAKALAGVGVRIVAQVEAENPAGAAGLGIRHKTEGGKMVVAEVLEDGAGWRSGLNAGDEILALDGFRVTESTLKARLQERAIGQTVELTVFRDDCLRTVPVLLTDTTPLKDKFEADPGADETARRLYETWTGEPHPSPVTTGR